MIYKLLFYIAFFSPYNGYYNLEEIRCPQWVPDSNQLIPQEVALSPMMTLHNKMRCYCQVVKAKERECIVDNVPRAICLGRTKSWVEANFSLRNLNMPGGIVTVPTRNLIVNVE